MAPDLNHLLSVVEDLDDRALAKQPVRHYVELELASDHKEYRIAGNSEGLIHLARVCIELAVRGSSGSHRHLDATGIADRCNVPLVLIHKTIDWDAVKR